MSKNYEIDMINGPLFSKLIKFSIPLILSGILQLLFNAADIVVVGKYAGSQSLAAVGSTGALINLLVNMFIGVSIGTNVLLGRYRGALDYENCRKTVHTSMWIAIYGGFLMIFVGVIGSKFFLELMGTPSDVINLSTLYMRIYFMGMPFFMVYNFGAAILRTVGDTKRPLYFLSIAGAINVVLNLIFVIIFNLGVAGVALATIISQAVSALFIILSLIKSEGYIKLDRKEIKLDKEKLWEMLRIGLPAGIQGSVFSISNILIQSSVNSFGSLVMAGNTASGNIEGFVYTSMNAIYQSTLSFTSQNVGAKKYKRVNEILMNCLVIVIIIGLILGLGAYWQGEKLLGLYSNDPLVIGYGMNRLSIICVWYFLCGIMEVFVGSIRGLGYSVMPMLVSLTGACLFRIIWIFTIFKLYRSQYSLYVSYPLSWILTAFMHFICYLIVYRKVLK